MDGGDPQRITVVTETRNLRTISFIQNDDPLSTGKQWEDWLEGIEREFRYFKITQPEDKKDALLIYGGKELVRLEKSLKNNINNEQSLNQLSNQRPQRERRVPEHFNDYIMSRR